ncbi:DUF5319 family protein [Salininema proteolyticum]|uniref:DUF5319 family protein n=1 Tax=Salininema proteolyticum TaxID=1607685 RepID=A0ABV8U519_9ACTN
MHEEPLDPFEGDAYFDEPQPTIELDPCERAEFLEDLHELETFHKVLQPLGFTGVVMDCPDCDDTHYFSWELMMANLRHMLSGTAPMVHEPACGADPDRYVSWEYARGYTDAWLRLDGPSTVE